MTDIANDEQSKDDLLNRLNWISFSDKLSVLSLTQLQNFAMRVDAFKQRLQWLREPEILTGLSVMRVTPIDDSDEGYYVDCVYVSQKSDKSESVVFFVN